MAVKNSSAAVKNTFPIRHRAALQSTPHPIRATIAWCALVVLYGESGLIHITGTNEP